MGMGARKAHTQDQTQAALVRLSGADRQCHESMRALSKENHC